MDYLEFEGLAQAREPLLLLLWELFDRIRKHSGALRGENLLERFQYFISHSDKGRDCPFAKKSRNLFLQHDLQDVCKILDKIEEERKRIACCGDIS